MIIFSMPWASQTLTCMCGEILRRSGIYLAMILVSKETDVLRRWESQTLSYLLINFKVIKLIGHFRVPLCLGFKASLSAKPFL